MQEPALPSLDDFKSWLPRPPVLIAWLVLFGILWISYQLPSLTMFEAWWEEAEYGHGFFVVPFALILLLLRHEIITGKSKPVFGPFPERTSFRSVLFWMLPSAPARLGALGGAAAGVLLFVVVFSVQRADLAIPEITVPEPDGTGNLVQLQDALPEAELPDLEDKRHSLSDFYGKRATVVCFWKGGNTPEGEREAIGTLQKLQGDYSNPSSKKVVHVIAVNEGDDPKVVRAQLANARMEADDEFAVLSDAEGTLLAKVGARELPRAYLLDADGAIVWFGQGFSTETRRDLRQAVDAVVSLKWLEAATWLYLLLAGVCGAMYGGLLFQLVQVLVHHRVTAEPLEWRLCWWLIPLLLLWVVIRWVSAFFVYITLDIFSILPFLAAFVLFVGGWRYVRWAWPSILFLVFMMKLPGAISGTLSHPLQWFGTKVAVFIVQTLGIAATAQGNVIKMSSGDLQVVEACSGLRMLILFFAICVGAALVIRVELWERIVIVVSAVPIAIVSNVARLTITAILYEMSRWWPEVIDTATADAFFHDWAGLFMMPLALLMLWGEMALLKKLFLEPASGPALSLGGALAGVPRRAESESAARRKSDSETVAEKRKA
ncbi:MAG TPA: archaeosortase/exosortase family protein [Thermoguttaceae bacterium]|nr:archaeosortase/exosortase family protein [Thermoguttaceae bacterium]